MAGSVTVKDVAREADVSVGTVSRVFNNHSNVTEEVRLRVLKAAAALGYFGPRSQELRANESSRALKEIGFLYYSNVDKTAATMNPFWSHILNGAESEARKSSVKVTYRAIGELTSTPDILLTTLYEMKLGGILLVGPAEPETIRLLQTMKLPLVLVDNYVPGLSIDAVLADNFEGARTAVDYLLSRGHRKIAFIGGPTLDSPRPSNKIYTLERRAAGYRTALLDAGLPVNYKLYVGSNDLSAEGGYEACKRLLMDNGDNAFSAIFCANDELAIGAMKAVREAGYRVPEDLSFVGFDDIAMVEHLTPALTTVRVNKEALGHVAVKSLLARFADFEAVSVTSILDVELVRRASVSTYTS
ncbi:MAG: LacI family DNA-binding transcriptional regulator [Ktedonobacteraceae bacterium]